MTPIVKVDIDYKYPLYYGDKAIVETTFINQDSAKVVFGYRIFRASDNVLVCTATTIQVFLNMERELQLTNPPFYEEWKKKWGFN